MVWDIMVLDTLDLDTLVLDITVWDTVFLSPKSLPLMLLRMHLVPQYKLWIHCLVLGSV